VVIDSKERKSFRAGESLLARRAESVTTKASVAALSEALRQLSAGVAEATEIIETKKDSQLIVWLAGNNCENDEKPLLKPARTTASGRD
jgi:hypothetical protein